MNGVAPPRQGLCPACGAPIRRAHATHGLFACAGCGGIWADVAAAQALRQAADPSIVSVAQVTSSRARFAAADTGGRRCPSCLGALARTTIGGAVTIDYCMAHGTWFDRGEIEAIVNAARRPRADPSASASRASSSGGEVALGVLEVCVSILGAIAD